MKLILLAAAAIAMPALAQTSGSTGASSPTSNGGMGTPTQTMNSSTDSQSTVPSSTQTMPDQSMSTQSTMPAQTTGGDPVGGYQPSTMAPGGPPAPGATVTFQQPQTPDQAYPAPAPMAHYPPCKPGQYDNCMQTSGSHARKMMHRRK